MIKDYQPIEAERIILKELTLDYLEEVYQLFSDPEITKYMDIEPCKDLKEAEEIITYHLEDAGCRWGIFNKSTNEFMGTCGFHYLRKKDNGEVVAEVGFDLARSFWGKGYMREAMNELCRYGFYEMQLSLIDATVEPGNERSISLMNKLGFVRSPQLTEDNLIYFYLEKRANKSHSL